MRLESTRALVTVTKVGLEVDLRPHHGPRSRPTSTISLRTRVCLFVACIGCWHLSHSRAKAKGKTHARYSFKAQRPATDKKCQNVCRKLSPS